MRSESSVAPGHRFAAALPRPLIGLATVVILVVAGIVAGIAPAAAQGRPPGGELSNPVVRAIDLASPAVVRIATLYSAQLTLTACGVTATLPASGAYTVGGLGSGAFVSAHGDILTADHVVDIDRQSLDESVFVGRRSSADIAAFLNAVCRPAAPVRPADVAAGIVQFNGFPYTVSYSKPQILVWRSTSYLGSIRGGPSGEAPTLLTALLSAPHLEANLLTSSSFGEDDIALLHVNLDDTPNIQLDASSQLAVEDTLAVIGFPGNGDVNSDPTNLLTPSVNNVSVSALKSNDNGSQLIQVGGNVEHGDSGGPALDTAGHIVGIVSFGGSDTQGITAFLRASDNALELLKAAHIDTTPGTFQTLWQQAFKDYAATDQGHWSAASREMDALSARYPEFHGLDAYHTYANNAAIHEDASSPSVLNLPALPLPLPIIAAIVGGVVLLLLIILVVVTTRRRARQRRNQRAAQEAPGTPALAPLPAWPSSGLPQGYNGATAPSYPPTAYNAPPQPRPSAYPPQTSPRNAWQENPSAYAPYPGAQSQGNAAYGSAASQPRPPSGPTPPSGAPQERVTGGLCVNGHQVPPGAARCLVCGAERARSAVTTPRDANLPPWSWNG